MSYPDYHEKGILHRTPFFEALTEETNLMCVFETSNRMKLMEEIRRVMPHIKDSDMEELAEHMLKKLDGMTDKEFVEISLEATEE